MDHQSHPLFFARKHSFKALLCVLSSIIWISACMAESDVKPPEGAVKISSDLYAVPLPEPDQDGCEQYRLWSAENMVVQAIHYRKANGDFTMNKNEAACMKD